MTRLFLHFWNVSATLYQTQVEAAESTFSDARPFCKNKQVNLKNKLKIGSLTQKQAQHEFGRKIKQKKQQEN